MYSVYDKWKKFVWENLVEVIFTTDDAYFNASRIVEKLCGI